MIVIPTIFATNKADFLKRFERINKISKEIQIDFMDGKFVQSRGVSMNDIPNLKGRGKKFEAHLMVSNPEDYLSDLKKKGFKKVLFHYESAKGNEEIKNLFFLIESMGMKPFLVFNPETNFNDIVRLLYEFKDIKNIMLMGVHPGREKQKMDANIYRKIENIKKIRKNIIIQIDGGVSMENIEKLKKAGADIVNSGSLIAEAENPKEVLERLKKA